MYQIPVIRHKLSSSMLTLTFFSVSRYDHLSEVLSKILDERPNDCIGKVSQKTFLQSSLIHYPICQLIEAKFFSSFALTIT